MGPLMWKSPSGQRPLNKEDHILNNKAKTTETLNIKPLSEAMIEPPITRKCSGSQLLELETIPLKVNLPLGELSKK